MYDLTLDNHLVKEINEPALSIRRKKEIIKDFAEMNGLLDISGIEIKKRTRQHYEARRDKLGY